MQFDEERLLDSLYRTAVEPELWSLLMIPDGVAQKLTPGWSTSAVTINSGSRIIPSGTD